MQKVAILLKIKEKLENLCRTLIHRCRSLAAHVFSAQRRIQLSVLVDAKLVQRLHIRNALTSACIYFRDTARKTLKSTQTQTFDSGNGIYVKAAFRSCVSIHSFVPPWKSVLSLQSLRNWRYACAEISLSTFYLASTDG